MFTRMACTLRNVQERPIDEFMEDFEQQERVFKEEVAQAKERNADRKVGGCGLDFTRITMKPTGGRGPTQAQCPDICSWLACYVCTKMQSSRFTVSMSAS